MKTVQESKTYQLNIKGIGLIQTGQIDEAIQCFESAIAINPDEYQAWYNKGTTLELMERYEDAIKCFDQVNRIDPSYSRAWVLKGQSLAKIKKYEEAQKCLDTAEKLSKTGNIM